MTFSDAMKIELGKPLDKKNVKPPAPGKYGEYVEGWHVIVEANRIFGFDGWTRETVEMVEVCKAETKIGKNQDAGWMVGYRAKVKVTAQGVTREGSAVGNGEARKLYDAIESAVKEAETDAMKRALMTFGYPFGLALYDKTKANVSDDVAPQYISDAQRTELIALAQSRGVPLNSVLKYYAIPDLRELLVGDFEGAKNGILNTPAKGAPAKEKETA